jgi:hypothetical protein
MQYIKCTKKLQKEMGLKPSDLNSSEIPNDKLGPWHANLIYIDGKKCIIFANDKTLFNFIATGVTKSQIKELSNVFLPLLRCTLASENIPVSTIEEIVCGYNEISYRNTDNKSVLGSINDLAFHYKYLIQSEGGIHSHMIPHIISKLNHMPMGALKYKYSIDALREAYGIQT